MNKKWMGTALLVLFLGVPSGFAREATWSDINDVKDKVSSKLSDVKSELSYQISDLRSEISRIRSELRELRSELAKTRRDLKTREPATQIVTDLSAETASDPEAERGKDLTQNEAPANDSL
ncbi:MAG TPA: hypothetical protein PKL97_05465 [Candidatus Omnitrophota bacterium]|nr:hypothetical protein [Candidatus Omnitrophota bacterium]